MEFNNLFGIKKHELDKSQLMMFGSKYLQTLELFAPTMDVIGDDESDHEELFYIKQRDIYSIVSERRIHLLPDLNNQMIPCPITIELLGIDNKDFLGLKVSRYNS